MFARRYFVSGDVQGVGFRYFVVREISRIGPIQGFVRNLRDGRVEVYAEAEHKHLQELEATLKRGPRSSRVERVEVFEETPEQNYRDFHVKF